MAFHGQHAQLSASLSTKFINFSLEIATRNSGCATFRPSHSGPRLSGPLLLGLNVAKIGPERRTSMSFRPKYFLNVILALNMFRIHLMHRTIVLSVILKKNGRSLVWTQENVRAM
jgi:hypothetical protein